MEQIEIVNWSGIWLREERARVGVRLADGRDALLSAFWTATGDGVEPHFGYSLVIGGEDFTDDFIIPVELEKALSKKMASAAGNRASVSLKDLQLF